MKGSQFHFLVLKIEISAVIRVDGPFLLMLALHLACSSVDILSEKNSTPKGVREKGILPRGNPYIQFPDT